jgi:hypothetical protein
MHLKFQLPLFFLSLPLTRCSAAMSRKLNCAVFHIQPTLSLRCSVGRRGRISVTALSVKTLSRLTDAFLNTGWKKAGNWYFMVSISLLMYFKDLIIDSSLICICLLQCRYFLFLCLSIFAVRSVSYFRPVYCRGFLDPHWNSSNI